MGYFSASPTSTWRGNSEEEAMFEDCVFDVCHGAGETAAEMAEELMMSGG